MNPRTRAEAEAKRYGQWAGNERGHSFKPGRCAMSVYDYSKGAWYTQQCSRAPGQGPDGLYCKEHARKVNPDV